MQQATVLFNPTANGGRGETRAMRSKEDAHDYRYFPDPDLPPLVIATDWIERVRAAMPELPQAMAARFQRDYGLPAYDALAVTQSKAHAAYFEAATAVSHQPKLVANWMMGEIAAALNKADMTIDQIKIEPAVLGTLISRIVDGTLHNRAAREVFAELWPVQYTLTIDSAVHQHQANTVDLIIDAKGLRQQNDTGELDRLLDELLAANTKSVEEYRAGKEKAFNALVGQAMKATQGKANPAQVTALLKKKLG